jgi:hypothetical protein
MNRLLKRLFSGGRKGMGAFLLFSLFTGCAVEPPVKQQDDSPGYQAIKIERKIPLIPENAEGPGMRLSLALLDTNISEPLRNLLWNLLYDGVSPGEYGNILISYYETQYADSDYSGVFMESMNWEYTERILPEILSRDIVVISRSREYYLGGAHGMQEKAYFVISLEGPKQLKLDDLLRDGAKPELRALMEDALRDSRGLGRGEPLSAGGFFEDSVEIPGNFFLTREGLGFRWDPYEIGPYVMGPVEITLPYEMVRPLLSVQGPGSLIP